MWRSAVVGRAAALGRRAVACARAPSIPMRPASAVPVLPRPDSNVRHRHTSTRTTLLLCPPVSSRGFVRMRRRSPLAQMPPEESESECESESESESESDAEELDLTAEAASEIDDGDESEEWEGIVIDFGADGRDKDNEEVP